MNIQELYYNCFIEHIIETYTPLLQSAKAGHCMKLVGLSINELRLVLPRLQALNNNLEVYILSDTLRGNEYIHATKLIELRNNMEKSLLILIPSNSRTSAEDSYGDATFQVLSVREQQGAFYHKLIDKLPAEKLYIWNKIEEKIHDCPLSERINYLLYVENKDYSLESWGNGLYFFDMLPDSDLLKNETSLSRRFTFNQDKVSAVLGDYSLQVADRVLALPLKQNTKQRELLKFLMDNNFEDSRSLFESIHDNHPEYNFAALEWLNNDIDNQKVKIKVNLVPGKDPTKELVKSSDTGNYILKIPSEKKGKVRFSILCEPAPKDNPDISSFEIAMVNIDDFSEVGVVKKAKVTTNKNAKRILTLNIANGMFDDGEYMLRVRALDKDGIVLEYDEDEIFKEDIVQAAWMDAKRLNPELQLEQFRTEHHVAYSYESEVFTIDNNPTEVIEEGTIDKRTRVNSFTQALISFRIAHLIKKEDLDIPSVENQNSWNRGTLTSTYQFDFGAAYAYQIQMSNKLMQIERTFLQNPTKLGYVEALLSGNPTDVSLINPKQKAQDQLAFESINGLAIPEELLSLRQDLFTMICGSVLGDKGLTCTFDFYSALGKVKEYVSEYSSWLGDVLEQNLDEETMILIQNIDTAQVSVEMPNGKNTQIKLISPLHPLRLAWMVNLYELYQDWENRTLENNLYRKMWYRKLDRLFLGQLPMDIAPLVLSVGLLQESFQYVGELTYGWGMYCLPIVSDNENVSSSHRQLKSYTAMLLNVSRERQIDSEVSLPLVVKHIMNYSLTHPYADKLIINLFNAGDANIFAQALVELEKGNVAKNITYEIRLFSDDNTLLSGEAFKDLLSPDNSFTPEAEVFSQVAKNRLFPKLRFSINSIEEFMCDHDSYPAHMAFLVSPFAIRTELVRPDELARSFYLNGSICRTFVKSEHATNTSYWHRYFSNKTIPNPVSEFANTTIGLFARLQGLTGMLLSSTIKESVPATSLRLLERDSVLLSFIHDTSDWVITFDKNMGPEFYDLPCVNETDVPYLLDYVPCEETTGLSSYLTTKPTSEIEALMIPLFREYGIELKKRDNFRQILEDVRSVSSSLLMQVNETSNKSFEVLGTTLTKRFLEKKGIMKESFLVPIDLHKELFKDLDSDNKERADNLVVKIDTQKRELLFTVVEIKCRNSHYASEDLYAKMADQIANTITALRAHYEIMEGADRLDRELKTLELRELLEFYINRSSRYGCIDPEVAHEYLLFLSKLAEGYTIRFKELGVVFDFLQQERQKKHFHIDTLIYSMGQPVIEEVLSKDSTLNTKVLEAMDKEIIDFFEPTTRRPTTSSEPMELTDEPNELLGEENMTDNFPKITTSAPSIINPPIIEKHLEQDENEETPLRYDVMIGESGSTPQYGILGKVTKNGRIIGLDLNGCYTMSLFGVQGAGKSYTIGSITEMVLKSFPNANKLPSPMAGVIFHYSDSMDYAPEFTSMVYPNDERGQYERLKAEYGVDPGRIEDIVLLTPESQVEKRQEEYPNLEVHPIGFDSSELQVKDWTFLLGAIGNDSTYIREFRHILKSCRNNMSLQNIRHALQEDRSFTQSQRSLAEQRLSFAEEYIRDGNKLRDYLRPGRLIIVDLRDEFIEKEEALGLFVVMLNIFSDVKSIGGNKFNKFIVFDEAHKYMNNKELVGSITGAIREMRHKGVSVMIASQDPMSLSTEIIELSSIVVMHRFSSPAWVKHMQKAITALQTLTSTEMASLNAGEAFVWANKASDNTFTQRPMKISIRPRITKHGGETIQAVRE